jgi:hypothetical protein
MTSLRYSTTPPSSSISAKAEALRASLLFEDDSTFLGRETWSERKRKHVSRVRQWVRPFLDRRSRHQKHPVYDFLFDYYSFRPAQLLRWSPGPRVTLEANLSEMNEGFGAWQDNARGVRLKPFPSSRLPFVHWALDFLQRSGDRPGNFGCFGLHEWAMVYRESTVRHQDVPLRLPRHVLDRFVESQQLSCTHFDAFRFFSEPAKRRNQATLQRSSELDQPACIHANMDLYRFCYKIAPWVESELLVDAFELALRAREIDMRASPYDLTRFGFDPIPVETPEGRSQYVRLQKEIAELARDLRNRLIAAFAVLAEG